MLTMSNEDIVENFIDGARAIVHQDMVFNMRRRMNGHHPAEDIDKETKLHNAHQQIAWQIVKKLYVENNEIINKYAQTLNDSDRSIVSAITKVIDEEMDKILLGEE